MYPTPSTHHETLAIPLLIKGIHHKQIVRRMLGRIVLQAATAAPQEGEAAAVVAADTEAAADTVGEDTFQTSPSTTIRTTLPQEATRSLGEAEAILEEVVVGEEGLPTWEINSTPLHPTAICLPL